MKPTKIRNPRCFLVYALAPQELAPGEANRVFNDYVDDQSRGLAVYHDHFIGPPGGVAVFFAEDDEQRRALEDSGPLDDWDLQIHPLIFARNPAGFDEQIDFTLRQYRSADWETLQQEDRPSYGREARREAETAREAPEET